MQFRPVSNLSEALCTSIGSSGFLFLHQVLVLAPLEGPAARKRQE